ncbi:unnamed protein product, partial [Staurois parvus]
RTTYPWAGVSGNRRQSTPGQGSRAKGRQLTPQLEGSQVGSGGLPLAWGVADSWQAVSSQLEGLW